MTSEAWWEQKQSKSVSFFFLLFQKTKRQFYHRNRLRHYLENRKQSTLKTQIVSKFRRPFIFCHKLAKIHFLEYTAGLRQHMNLQPQQHYSIIRAATNRETHVSQTVWPPAKLTVIQLMIEMRIHSLSVPSVQGVSHQFGNKDTDTGFRVFVDAFCNHF